MLRTLSLLCLLSVPNLAFPAEPEVNLPEIARRGDHVQVIDGLHHGGADEMIAEAMAPPQSDADKWFISVITTEGCSACEDLKREWKRSRWLQNLAEPKNPKRSWAHFAIYSRQDATQSWRWDSIQLSAYPTIIVQPPKNGRYGSNSTVVYQGVYGGDPKALASDILVAIRQYIRKISGYTPKTIRASKEGSLAGAPPPWDQFNYDRRPNDGGGRLFPLRIPPGPYDGQESIAESERLKLINAPWSSLLAILMGNPSIGAFVLIGVFALRYIRQRREDAGHTPFLGKSSFESLIEMIEERFGPAEEAEDEPETVAPKKVVKKTTRRKRRTS